MAAGAKLPADGDTVDKLLRTADQRLYEQRGIELRDAGSHEITARAGQPRPIWTQPRPTWLQATASAAGQGFL